MKKEIWRERCVCPCACVSTCACPCACVSIGMCVREGGIRMCGRMREKSPVEVLQRGRFWVKRRINCECVWVRNICLSVCACAHVRSWVLALDWVCVSVRMSDKLFVSEIKHQRNELWNKNGECAILIKMSISLLFKPNTFSKIGSFSSMQFPREKSHFLPFIADFKIQRDGDCMRWDEGDWGWSLPPSNRVQPRMT